MDAVDLVCLSVVVSVGAVTAFRPRWTFYVLSCGHPERVDPRGIRFVRLCAGLALLGAAISGVMIALGQPLG